MNNRPDIVPEPEPELFRPSLPELSIEPAPSRRTSEVPELEPRATITPGPAASPKLRECNICGATTEAFKACHECGSKPALLSALSGKLMNIVSGNPGRKPILIALSAIAVAAVSLGFELTRRGLQVVTDDHGVPILDAAGGMITQTVGASETQVTLTILSIIGGLYAIGERVWGHITERRQRLAQQAKIGLLLLMCAVGGGYSSGCASAQRAAEAVIDRQAEICTLLRFANVPADVVDALCSWTWPSPSSADPDAEPFLLEEPTDRDPELERILRLAKGWDDPSDEDDNVTNAPADRQTIDPDTRSPDDEILLNEAPKRDPTDTIPTQESSSGSDDGPSIDVRPSRPLDKPLRSRIAL